MGNFHNIPTEMPWITYTEWRKQYGAWKIFSWPSPEMLYLSGDVVHAQVFRDHILIVDSLKAAMELFEKRARIYSDRPPIPMVPL